MDHYRFDSDTIESLTLLRPPVTSSDLQAFQYFNEHPTGVSLLKDFRRSLHRKIFNNTKRDVGSSVSLVLEKTSQKNILEQYSFHNYSSLKQAINISSNPIDDTNNKNCDLKNFDKPLINITVIPKHQREPKTKKFLKKRKQAIKAVQTTSSNHENSICTKNVYLVVAGRKKEKIYEIKTTGSAKFAKDGDVNEVGDYKNILESLKMDKKKKKGRAKKETVDTEVKTNVHPDCVCLKRENSLTNLRPGSSKVRVFGRIGVTENDKYVFHCAATIDDQPVPQSYTKTETEKFPLCLARSKDYASHQRDNSIQADFNNSPTIESAKLEKLYSRESQATQVNFDVKITTNPYRTNDQILQCDYSDIVSRELSYDNEPEGYTLRTSNSPLVIISVYPKHAGAEVVETVNGGKVDNKRPAPNKTKMQNNKPREFCRTEDLKRNRKLRCSRTPSPAKKVSKSKIQEQTKKNVEETRHLRATVKKESSYLTNSYSKTKSLNQQRDIDISKQDKTSFNNNRNDMKKQNTKTRSISQAKGIDTDQSKQVPKKKYAKKISSPVCSKKEIALQNEITLNNKMKNYEKSFPRNDVSKISVNIDSDKEYYDVIYQQQQYTTDLTVRKTMKEVGSQKHFKENPCKNRLASDSLQNLFPSEVSSLQREPIPQKHNNTTSDGIPLSIQASLLNVRDSLEIKYRREGKDMKNTQTKSPSERKSINGIDTDFMAPIKHFTGDDCKICDPIERDKEIRGLLGIEKSRINIIQPKNEEHKSNENGDSISDHCLFHNKLCESLLAGLMFKNICSCTSCIKKKIALFSDQLRSNLISNYNDDIIINYITDYEKNLSEFEERFQSTDGLKEDIIATVTIDLPNDMVAESTQCEQAVLQNTTEYEGPNHYDQIYLPLSHSKQKPIVLSRKQYSKVKRTLRNTVTDKNKKRRISWKSSSVFLGEITEKPKKEEVLMHWNKEVQTDALNELENFKKIKKSKIKVNNVIQEKDSGDYQKNTIVLFSKNTNKSKSDKKLNAPVRKIASSIEVRYAGITYMREMAYSFTNISSVGSSFAQKKPHSIETLFRGHKKSRTPNLGASALSLLSEKSITKSEIPCALKPKKPFLRRLMSCLVMRSARASKVIVPGSPRPPPTVNSSIDSYHISTSLGAIDMSSSLYDTSASFYSNHTIGPINNKMKRGFFSSVRGFLTTRRS